MRATEIIEKIQELVKERGDLDVLMFDRDYGYTSIAEISHNGGTALLDYTLEEDKQQELKANGFFTID